MYFLYLDESYDKKSRYIILAGFIVNESEWGFINEEVKKLKIKYFKDPNINLKELRRKNYDENQSYNNLSPEERSKFNEELYRLLESENFTFLAALIDQSVLENKDKNFWFQLAYSFLIQRFQYFLQEKRSRGLIIIDQSKNEEIKNLFFYHKKCLDEGVPVNTVLKKIEDSDGEVFLMKDYEYMDLTQIVEHLHFLDDDHSNHLQIADLICAAFYGKYNRNADYYYKKIESRIRKCSKTGKIEGFGIKIFPKES